MGISTSAYGAKAGIKTFVLIKEDTSQEKLLSAGIYGSILVKVKGDYGELQQKSRDIGKKHGIYFMNSTDPFRIDGYQIIGLEIFDQLDNQSPQYIFVPVSSGGHLIGLMKAYKELKKLGLIQHIPTFVGVQAQGCSPLAQAFSSGKPKVERISQPHSIAQSITNPDPPGGNIALEMIRDVNGIVMAVTDDEILTAQQLLAQHEGIFCLPASATTLAGLLQLQEKRKINNSDRIVLVITGSGEKNVKALDPTTLNIHESSLLDIDRTITSLAE
jgi:threonine synthase